MLLRSEDWQSAYRLLDEGMDAKDALQLRFILEYGARMPESDYWDLLRDAYKYAFRGLDALTVEQWRILFTSRSGIDRLMSQEEHRILLEYDESTILYRGYHEPERLLRFSWTLDEQTAAKFALLWHDQDGGDPMIARATARTQGIFAIWLFEA